MGISKFEVYWPFELSLRSNSKNKPDRRTSYKGIKLPERGEKNKIFWLSSLFCQWDWRIRVGKSALEDYVTKAEFFKITI